MENVRDQDVFLQSSVGLLNLVATYLIWYYNTYWSYSELESLVTKGFWDSMEVSHLSKNNRIRNQTQTDGLNVFPAKTMKLCIAEYPKFSGKSAD